MNDSRQVIRMNRIEHSESSLDVFFLESCEPKKVFTISRAKSCKRIDFGSFRRSHWRFGKGLGVARIETFGPVQLSNCFRLVFISVANPRMVRFRMGDVVLLPCWRFHFLPSNHRTRIWMLQSIFRIFHLEICIAELQRSVPRCANLLEVFRGSELWSCVNCQAAATVANWNSSSWQVGVWEQLGLGQDQRHPNHGDHGALQVTGKHTCIFCLGFKNPRNCLF